MNPQDERGLVPSDHIERKIYLIRGQKVMLDRDLAVLYEVETKALKQAVRRNIERFPDDFMFVLDREEFNNLRSQFVISSEEHGGALSAHGLYGAGGGHAFLCIAQ